MKRLLSWGEIPELKGLPFRVRRRAELIGCWRALRGGRLWMPLLVHAFVLAAILLVAGFLDRRVVISASRHSLSELTTIGSWLFWIVVALAISLNVLCLSVVANRRIRPYIREYLTTGV